MRKAVFAKALIISIVFCLTIFFKVSTGHAYSTYDTDQDWAIGNFELLSAIDDWAGGGLGNFDLLDLIDMWAFGNYCWDASTSSHKAATPDGNGACVGASLTSTLPDTGQTTCYDTLGSVISCAGTGQDGEYSLNPPSYTDNLDGTVTDNVTGLMWQQGTNYTARTWEQALTYCKGSSLAGYGDWRLPNAKELESITVDTIYNPAIDAMYFPGTVPSVYWSSTTGVFKNIYAWYGNFSSGHIGFGYKTGNAYIRCVR